MRFARFFQLSGLVAGIAACGSLDDAEQKPPLASLHGRIEVASSDAAPSDGASLRVAIVWLWPDRNLGGERVTRDIPVDATFPTSFSMSFPDPPPATAMLSKAKAAAAAPSGRTPGYGFDYSHWSDGTAVALGRLVAYEDTNRNGKLDLVDDEAGSFVDRILGSNETVLLAYIEGAAPPELTFEGVAPAPGYHLAFEQTCTGTLPDESCTGGGWKPMTTAVPLRLEADQRRQRYMCRNQLGLDIDHGFAGEVERTEVAPPASPPTPAPGDPSLKCEDGGKSYTYESCTRTLPDRVCQGQVQEECWTTHGMRSDVGATDPSWPCPVE